MYDRVPVPGARRVARFEAVEERLVLSASPWNSLVHHAELNAPLPDGSDTQLEAGGQLSTEQIAVAPHLNGAHAGTGVDVAHADYGFDGAGQTVVVIDSGIAYDHVALGGGFGAGGRVVGGWDFAENDADPYDDAPAGFHGTHVAGIIGSDNETYTGVAPQVDLVGLRVFDDSGNGHFGWVEDALQWVIDNQDTFDNPITTVNLSLGVPEMNYSDAPSWATSLESKFQTLNEAGIFVAVSAGNDFQLFNTKGLSYPAVSDWVVPVASADDAGTALSDFSQRDDHVLVAPGESIVSTVPDELFSFDGEPNDWAAASGTSMASPYVAGASVLVREAYAFMGMENVDQEMIYDVLYNTADLIADPITGSSYRFIDLEAALENVVPDTFADEASAATDMGAMGDGYSFAERIGRMDDRDYFSFVADQTGTMTLTAAATQEMAAQWVLVDGNGAADGDTLTFDVVAGQTYTVGLMSSAGIGHYDVNVELVNHVVDWGVVERNQFADVGVSGEQWYSVTSTRAGMLTAEANYANGDTVGLEFYNGSNQLIASGTSGSGYSRIDAQVAAGETVLLKVTGASESVDFNVWNIVGITGDMIEVFGTAGDDTFTFTAGATHQAALNGLEYTFADADLGMMMFRGGDGTDAITAIGGAGDDFAKVRTGFARLMGETYEVRGYDVESVEFAGGGGGNDLAYLYDSAGDDLLVATPEQAQLTSDAMSQIASGFSRVNVYATAGGNDVARLYDSTGNDLARSTPLWAYLRGDGFFNYATGFDETSAYATAGGFDRALMFDSVGDDLLKSKVHWTYFEGEGFYNDVRGFEQVRAFSTAGGQDLALMYDSVGNDILRSKSTWTFFQGDGFYNYAGGFERVNAYADAGGYDLAQLYDSPGNDELHARPELTYLRGDGFFNYVTGFDRVNALATKGGYDIAFMQDSQGNDLLKSTSSYTYLKGDGYFNYSRGFDQLDAHADRGGYDSALLYDAASGDTLHASGTAATLDRSDREEAAVGFAHVTAQAADSQSPVLELQAIDYVLESLGGWM